MFGPVHERIKAVQDAKDATTAVQRWRDAKEKINMLPYPPYSSDHCERFANVVQDYLEGQAGPDVPDLNHLEELMQHVRENDNLGKRPQRIFKPPLY